MCLVFLGLLIGPRVGIVVWWLLSPDRWYAVFDSVLVALLGFLFLPWTTLAWVLVRPGGVVGVLDWVLLGVALFTDLGSIGGGTRARR